MVKILMFYSLVEAVFEIRISRRAEPCQILGNGLVKFCRYRRHGVKARSAEHMAEARQTCS